MLVTISKYVCNECADFGDKYPMCSLKFKAVADNQAPSCCPYSKNGIPVWYLESEKTKDVPDNN